jgi:nucleoside 2-deoxyribosyltransferase
MDTKVYFCGSIKGGRQDRKIYEELIVHISKYAKVLTEHIADPSVGIDQHLSDKEIHDRDISWLRESDLIIAEVTQPSLGVGYEIGRALEWGKPIIALYRKNNEKKLSAMIAGVDRIKVFEYADIQDAKNFLDLTFQK